MPFEFPKTIKEVIKDIDKKNYLLPAIQREFVWNIEQIEKLFDSLMRDYPIGSFLFWEVEKQSISKYQFYEFIRDYNEKEKKHNTKASLSGRNGLTAILDGQQRLTALYIGLKGSYAYKLPRKRWNNNSAFPKRKLYLNLLPDPDKEGIEFNFNFLTDEEAEKKDDDNFWFAVSEILNLEEEYQVTEFLIENIIHSYKNKEQSHFANKTLSKLHSIIHKNQTINFFLEKDQDLDKVLNIFIRTNSGGTHLDYSDLLLSTTTAQWKKENAREIITSFVDDINTIGDGFNINKDFVLKSCLVIGKFKDIAFKVKNFNESNILKIEKKWGDISKAIKASFTLVSTFGYQKDTLPSNNSIIPIALYLYKIGSPDNFSESHKYKKDRDKIFKWLMKVLLRRTFGFHPDTILRAIRDTITTCPGNNFPDDEINDRLKATGKAISFDEEDIEHLLSYKYSKPHTHSVLALIYPTLDFKNKFHQDHIFPKRFFKKTTLKKLGIPSDDIDYFMDNYNRIANLQLIEGIKNQEKSSKEFIDWIKETYSDEDEKKEYMKRHYIPNVDLQLLNFKEFIEKREELILEEFTKLLK